MAKALPVGELADYGHWIVLQVVDDDTGDTHPEKIPGLGWCEWRGVVGGKEYAAVRTSQPVIGLGVPDVPVSAVLTAAGLSVRPRGRIQGK